MAITNIYIKKGGVAATMQQIIATMLVSFEQPRIKRLASELYDANPDKAAHNIWEYTRNNIRYQTDPEGKEIVREASATLDDASGDCEDICIVQCALAWNMGYGAITRFNLVAFNNNEDSGHIFTTMGNTPNVANRLILGISLDTCPPLQAFNQVGNGITRNWNILLTDMDIYVRKTPNISGNGQPAIMGIGENVAPADAVTRKLMDYQSVLLASLGVKGIASVDVSQELRKTHTLIKLNNTPERDMYLPLMDYIQDISQNGTVIWKDDAPIEDIADYIDEYLAAREDAVNGIGALKDKLKKVVTKFQNKKQELKKNPPPKQAKPKIIDKIKKVVHVLVKINPATIAARNGLYLFMELNPKGIANKLALGYLTEAEAKAKKLNIPEWQKLVKVVADIENIVFKAGGEKAKIKSVILKSAARRDKRLVKKGVKGIGIDPATGSIIVAAIPLLIAILAKTATVNGKKLADGATDVDASVSDATEVPQPSNFLSKLFGADANDLNQEAANTPISPAENGFNSEAEQTTFQTSQTSSENNTPSTQSDTPPAIKTDTEPDAKTKMGASETVMYLVGGGIALFVVGKSMKWF